MNAQQLRNSILQQAIQGKLVPQDPADEPASVLLQRIRKEKERLVKESKLKKKDLAFSNIFKDEEGKWIEIIGTETKEITDDIPFDIPIKWEWVRLKELVSLITKGSSPSWQGVKYVETGILFITSENVREGYLDLKSPKYLEAKFNELQSRSILRKGDLLTNIVGASIGRTAEFNLETDNSNINQAVAVIRLLDKSLNAFLLKLFNSPFVVTQMLGKTVETARPNISLGSVENLLVPLPPLPEQRRIVAKIEELMPLVERYGKAQEELDKLNEILPARLRQSILQEAIQGRLVPQDPKEEPASELLKRIRKEKEQLVKDGKLKKKDLESKPIEEDEIPFEIPESWEWVRLGEISTYSHTKKKINASKADSHIWGLDLEDIEKGGKLLCVKTVEERKAIGDKTYFNRGDILYSKLRPYLLKILVAPKDGICTPEIIPFTCFGNISSDYIVDVLKSAYVDDYINSVTFGVKMPRVSTETMTSLLIPLPPLSEQKRIVAKVEELFGVTDFLSLCHKTNS